MFGNFTFFDPLTTNVAEVTIFAITQCHASLSNVEYVAFQTRNHINNTRTNASKRTLDFKRSTRTSDYRFTTQNLASQAFIGPTRKIAWYFFNSRRKLRSHSLTLDILMVLIRRDKLVSEQETNVRILRQNSSIVKDYTRNFRGKVALLN